MAKGKRKSTKVVHSTSYYKLSEVAQRINSGQWLIRSNAIRDAYQEFGWGISDIINAYKMLKPTHFYKTDGSKAKPGSVIDIYKARLNGEDVYTHFYIDDSFGKLIINSFKRDQGI
ncbi:type II toxin-antitoxin system MqsR family toxin [Chloroflexota bacterium]